MLRLRAASIASALALLAFTALPHAQVAPLTDAQMEQFLLHARVVSVKPIGVGVTGSLRATLTDGTLTHDAQIQAVDEYKQEFRTPKGIEVNFRDTWRYNVAAYRVDRLAGLAIVPVSVERRWQNSDAAFTWWVDDVMMDEGKRMKKNLVAPDYACWTRQSQALRMLDQLIDNTDRNLGNTLIAKNWRLWAIDHTRAFRLSDKPQTDSLTSIDPAVLERLIALDFKTLRNSIGRYVGDNEIRKLLKRRDGLVAYYRSLGDAGRTPWPDPALGCLATAAE